MGKKLKPPQPSKFNKKRWFRLDAWLAANPPTVIHGHAVKTLGKISGVPILVVPTDTRPEQMKLISEVIKKATGRQPVLFNAPVRLMRAVEVTEDEAARAEPTVRVLENATPSIEDLVELGDGCPANANGCMGQIDWVKSQANLDVAFQGETTT